MSGREREREREEKCSVLQCVAVCCSVLQCAAVCCSVLHCVAFSLERETSVLHKNAARDIERDQCVCVREKASRVAVCCSVLQRVAVCCSVCQLCG